MFRIGIDEVGRGPLAGPVVVAAVALPRGTRLPSALGRLRDSKHLSRAARDAWASWITSRMPFAIASSTPRTIDARGISVCANACALRCYQVLIAKVGEAPVRLDGGLYLGSRERQARYLAETFPKADETCREVALASILAKVTRDRMMARYHRRYPDYVFDRNVGYGTRAHYEALLRYGACPIHRLTFLGSLGTIAGNH